jgi:hypothetical protein
VSAGREGGCLCGAVRYRIEGPLGIVGACHCGQCRRWTGHVLVSFDVPREALTVRGAVTWHDSTPGTARRGLCPVCGSGLFWERIGSETSEILVGTLDEPTGLRLAHHIHVADKGDYYEIADGLPAYPQDKPS